MIGDHASQLVIDSQRSIQTGTLLRYQEPLIRSLIRESHSLAAPVELAIASYSSNDQQPTQEIPEPIFAEVKILSTALQRNRRGLHVYFEQRLGTLKERYWSVGGSLSAGFGMGKEIRGNMVGVDEGFVKGYAELSMRFKISQYGDPDEEEDDDEGDLSDGDDFGEEFRESFNDVDDDDERRNIRSSSAATTRRRRRRTTRRTNKRRTNGTSTGGTSLMDAIDLLGGGIDQDPPRDTFLTVRVLQNVGDVETLSGARLSLIKGNQYFLPRDDVEQMVVLGQVEIID